MCDFVPQGQVTGIGSLPHKDPAEAVRFVAEFSPIIPFWPQLPKRCPAEMMVAQVLTPLLEVLEQRNSARFDVKSTAIDSFQRWLRETEPYLDANGSAGFFAFEQACEANMFTQARALKGQMTGPITLAHCLFANGRALASQPEFHTGITDYLCQLGLWQIQRLQRFGKPVLFFIDEPVLGLGTSSASQLNSLRRLIDTLKTAGAQVGIHCCASQIPPEIYTLQLDIISFDAYQQLESFLACPATHTYLDSGGHIAFGLIPTLVHLGNVVPTETWMRWLTAVQGAYDLNRLASQSLITATCGLGLLTLKAAQTVFEKCHELSELIITVSEQREYEHHGD
jgi:methionine synthase II (cobalamin-independent)